MGFDSHFYINKIDLSCTCFQAVQLPRNHDYQRSARNRLLPRHVRDVSTDLCYMFSYSGR